ncbi:TolC family protein [Rhodopirellula bahusiensis]|uniref:TolC family protein n=2 Tax=Rhodopirellula bahusiensis TaxID=2014065 RepID=UPI0026CECB6E
MTNTRPFCIKTTRGRTISATAKRARRLLLLSALGFTTGCQTLGQHVASTPSLRQATDVTAVAVATSELQPPVPHSPSQKPRVQTVAYTEIDTESMDGEGDDSNEDDTPMSLRDAMSLEDSGTATVAEPIFLDSPVVDFGQSTGMTLEQFESLALQNNPTIAELVATTQKAAGYRTQVSLRANPSIGYQANQLADQGTDQHTFFISQTIVTANKLALNRSVLNESMRAQLFYLEAQKYRVATDIRVKFYDALAAQRRVQLIQEFQLVSDQGLEFAELRKRAEEGSQLDVVQAKVLKNEIDLQLRQAKVRFNAAWRELVAFAGTPQMAPTDLQGELPRNEVPMDWNSVAANIVVANPEYQAAQSRVTRARALICRHEVQPIPNLDVSLGSGYDNATDNGLINFQIGAPIPVFNKNQGNISAARAEYVRASREVERIENAIKARLATAAGDFDASLAAVDQYANDILPNAQEGLDLSEIAYKAGETNYVQVLIAQRTYFETNLQYIAAQALLGQARARIDGYVLTGSLDPVVDNSGDDSLRGLTFSQQ